MTRVTEPAVANFGPWVTVTPTWRRRARRYTFSFPKARQDRFTVYFENGLTLTGIEAPDLKSWKLTAGADRQTLEVMLNEAAREEYSFSITCERPMPKLPAELRAPVFSAAAKRLESGVALFAGKGVEVTAQPAATLRQTPLTPPSETRGDGCRGLQRHGRAHVSRGAGGGAAGGARGLRVSGEPAEDRADRLAPAFRERRRFARDDGGAAGAV